MAREPFNEVWANAPTDPGNDASFKEPRASIFDTGWEGGADKDAPKAGEQNWWQNRADSALQDVERYGVMTWDTDAIYAAGAPVKASDGNYYESLGNTNTGNNPATTTGFWRLIGTSLYSVIPVGSVIAVAHNGVPDTGWLKCNGSVVLRTTYSRLFDKLSTTWNTSGEATTQFRLPDFRGEFLRGFDDSRGVDSGRTFASAQASQNLAHQHGSPTAADATAGPYEVPAPAGTRISGVTVSGFAAFDYGGTGGAVAYTSVDGGTEARPRNRAINFWIKY